MRHRYAVEVLDALAAHPRTARELAAAMPSRELGRTLRMLAVHGLIYTEASGSWDTTDGIPGVLRLTLAGATVVHNLSKFDVWEALYGG
ncbi:hypothetical protein [Nocardia transvalensis]|uniref:hypothetical protein n=1 Tax=Nocardia transvalensis TaxID=37333 RepID=UPI001E3FDFE0|nr:hypothetical protein [Nocardia transvalensis]MBF6329307.1 hypothetical protein [Nocardia transvalensis]